MNVGDRVQIKPGHRSTWSGTLGAGGVQACWDSYYEGVVREVDLTKGGTGRYVAVVDFPGTGKNVRVLSSYLEVVTPAEPTVRLEVEVPEHFVRSVAATSSGSLRGVYFDLRREAVKAAADKWVAEHPEDVELTITLRRDDLNALADWQEHYGRHTAANPAFTAIANAVQAAAR